MTIELHILCAIFWPLLGAIGIALLGQRHANGREAVTLVTSVVLAVLVWTLLPDVAAGDRPSVLIADLMPGLAIDNSAKGWSDSTTTARFIGTVSALVADPFTILRVSAWAAGTATVQSETPSIPAARVLFMLM